MHVLDGDMVGVEEVEEFFREVVGLHSPHGDQSKFFTIDGGGGEEFLLHGFIFGFRTLRDGDAEDGGTKIGVNGLFVFTGCVELESFLCFRNDSAILSANGFRVCLFHNIPLVTGQPCRCDEE